MFKWNNIINLIYVVIDEVCEDCVQFVCDNEDCVLEDVCEVCQVEQEMVVWKYDNLKDGV